MHTVCETHPFQRAAKAAGMGEEEVVALVNHLAQQPDAGVVIPGTGGCRKLRWAAPGRGKSGGYRTITFYSGSDLPVFLLTVFAKGERSDLTMAERNALGEVGREIVEAARARVRAVGRGRRQ